MNMPIDSPVVFLPGSTVCCIRNRLAGPHYTPHAARADGYTPHDLNHPHLDTITHTQRGEEKVRDRGRGEGGEREGGRGRETSHEIGRAHV